MYKIKYILNIWRGNFVFNHDVLFLPTYIKMKVSYLCIVSFWEYTYFFSALKFIRAI